MNDSIKLNFRDIIFSSIDTVHFHVLGKINNMLLVESNLDAPNGAIYKLDIQNPNKLEVFIKEYNEQLDYSTIMRNKIICAYSNDTMSFMVIWDSAGRIMKHIKIPAGRTFGEFSGNSDDSILVFSFNSFFTPSSMYTLSLNTYNTESISTTMIHFSYDGLMTKKVHYVSKDGTKIPMYLTYKAGIKLNGKNPVILYGYGGFGIKMEPFFNAANIIFLQNGGVLAVPCIRGGGDLPGWHEQGMRLKKQNSFDDFIAAAEYLVANGYTAPEKMAAIGGSNGRLLVASVMLQRPDLFKVIVARAGLFDMMRYHLFNIGYEWQDEYGNIKDSADFKNLYRYSPLQNVKQGVNYPAMLLVAGDNDDRVNPFHFFKFLAAMQANSARQNPCILYYEKQAGHVISRDVEKTEDTEAFIYSFIYKYLGIANKIAYNKPSW